MKRILLYVPLLLALLAPFPTAGGAEETAEESGAADAGDEAAEGGKEAAHRGFFDALYHLDEYKPTWKYLDWGIEERFRYDAYQNLQDLDYESDDKESLVRFRTRLWTKIKPLVDYEPLKKTEIYMRWVNEYRAYIDRKEGRGKRYPGGETIIMDQLYAKLQEPWGIPMYLRVGRMDMAGNILGDGFFFWDFTNGDTSRTKFYDGFDVGFWWPREKDGADHFTMFQVLGAYNKNEWWAVINEDRGEQRMLRRYDRERWLLFWLTHESVYTLKQKVEFFYMPYFLQSFGHDEWGNDLHKDLPEDMRAPDFHYTPDMKMHVFGGRLSGKVLPDFFDERLSYMLQAAWQMGTYGNEGLQAYCFSGKGRYEIPMPKKLAGLKPYVSSGYEVFSGDRDDTHRREGWTWPPTWQSVRPPYGHTIRDAEKYYEGEFPYSNMQAIPLELGWRPFWDKIKFTHYYAPLWALEKRSKADPNDFGESRFKGHVLYNMVTWDITKWLSTHVLFEWFRPGGFYRPDEDIANSSWFLRYELMVKF